MDRDTRILYRQRGSNLRKTVDEDNVLVIRTPMKLVETLPEPDDITSLKRSRDDNSEIGIPYEPDFDVQEEEDNVPVGNQPVLSPLFNNRSNYNEGRNKHRSKYQRITTANATTDFSNLSAHDLILSEQKIRCYDILKELVDFLFKENLMRKANTDSNKYSRDEVQSMMYKLDFKIFEKIVSGITNDLNDIKDINIANNTLLHNLSRIQKKKQRLNMELVDTRTQTTQLMTNEEFWYQNKTDQLKLNDRLRLNQGLKQLSKQVSTTTTVPNTTGGAAASPALPIRDNLPSVIQLLDPQHGILNKITKINEKLRKQYT